MSLTSALSIAQSALFSTSRQTSIVSRNVTEAQNPDYSRRTAVLASSVPGSEVISIKRATNEALFRQNLVATSSYEGQASLFAGMDRLGLAVNGADNASSAAAAISKLQEALQFYSAAPSNTSLAENTVEMARQTVRALNEGSQAIQSFRAETDTEIASAVGELNNLLAEFGRNNTAIVKGTLAGRDVSDELDQRDKLLKNISQYVSITTYTRAGNDMVVSTKDGATMFETSARAVTFEPVPAYAAGAAGNQILVDGVPLKSGIGGDTSAGGKLPALVQLRDGVAATMQSQLDEVARGLIVAFRETGGGPDAPGLFTWPGAPAMPVAGTISNGLAASISVHAAIDSNVGGMPSLLRDGGANGAAYVANAGGAASFSDLLISYVDRLGEPIAFDFSAGAGTGVSVTAYSSNAIGWFEQMRKDADNGQVAKGALIARTTEALSNLTGVNIDEEMALLLQLEQTYEASARLIRAVDDMLAALMAAVR